MGGDWLVNNNMGVEKKKAYEMINNVRCGDPPRQDGKQHGNIGRTD